MRRRFDTGSQKVGKFHIDSRMTRFLILRPKICCFIKASLNFRSADKFFVSAVSLGAFQPFKFVLRMKSDYMSALKYMRPKIQQWKPKVKLISSIEKEGRMARF